MPSLKLKNIFFVEEISAAARKQIETLDPNEPITVYHGTALSRVADLINGFDATTAHRRDYNASPHPGLFITADFETARSFGGGAILELQVPAKFLHGTDFGGKIGREQEKQGRMPSDVQKWHKDKYPESFRPFLSYTMLQTGEPQGLLRGVVKPSQIKKVFVKNYDTKNWDEYTRKEFFDAKIRINQTRGRDYDTATEKWVDKTTDIFASDVRVDLSNPKMSLEEFFELVEKDQGHDADDTWKVVERRAKRNPENLKHLLQTWKFGGTRGYGGQSRLGAKAVESVFKQIMDRVEIPKTEARIPTLQEAYQLNEVTLYHGTIIDHKKDIEDIGVMTAVGDWVKDAYGAEFDSDFTDEEVDQALGGITFAADKEEMDKAVGAMAFHTSKKLGKSFHDVTLDDIRNHGMLVTFKELEQEEIERQPEGESDDGWFRHPKDQEDISFYAQHPVSTEPGDYYFKSEDGDAIGFDDILTGKKMMRFLRRYDAFKYFGEDKRRKLIKLVLKHHKGRTPQEVIAKVDSLKNDREISDKLDYYEKLTGERALEEEFIGKKGGLSYFQMGGSLPKGLYNREKGKPVKDPGVAGLSKGKSSSEKIEKNLKKKKRWYEKD